MSSAADNLATNEPREQLSVVDWGPTDYLEALERQRQVLELRRNSQCPDQLIFTEHAPVYTLGLRKDAANHLQWTPEKLDQEGITVHQTNRGGDITYHGPGQIVAYPIISLQRRRDLHAYLRDLEQVVIQCLETFGLQTGLRDGKTGIWIEDRKLCAIGVAVKSWTTYHGFALNVNTNLNHFSGIIPCGITDGTVSSMQQELGHSIDLDSVKSRLAVEFRKVFQNT